jgi:hypothetical protein
MATSTSAGVINQISVMASYAGWCGTPATEIYITRANVSGGTYSGLLDCSSEHKTISETNIPSFPPEESESFSGGVYSVFTNFTGTQCEVNNDELVGIQVRTNSDCGGKGRTQSVSPSNGDSWFMVSGINGLDLTSYETSGFPANIISFTYSTTTGYANITGYWQSTTTPYISQRLSFWQYSDTLGRESFEEITATTTGVFNFSFPFLDPYSWTATTSTTTAAIYNSFTLNASLDQYDETNYVFPYGGTVITNLDATTTTISSVDNYNAIDFTLNPRQLALYPEYECSISSLTGCFKNALIWTFYPTQSTLDNWGSLKTKIETKAPIGYFFLVKNNINGLSATSTKAFDIVIPRSLKNYIFIPFDTSIAAILWFFFIFNFYKRLKHITI